MRSTFRAPSSRRTGRGLRLISATCGVLLGALAASEAAQEPRAPAPRVHQVTVEGMKFVPETVRIRPGDQVIFTNKDLFPHTATSRDKHGFDSGPIAAGQSWTITPKSPDPLRYTCTFHPTMHGTIVIEKP